MTEDSTPLKDEAELARAIEAFCDWASRELPSESYGTLPEWEPPAASQGEGPSHIGPYRVLEEIGRGGQGVVYRARDEKLHREVAVKVLDASRGRLSQRARLRFQREAIVASRLNHPVLCPVFDLGFHETVPYIVMPYIQGEPLSRLIARAAQAHPQSSGPVDLARTVSEPNSLGVSSSTVFDVLEVFEELARGLHAAHEAGIIHRDIKPANIMIELRGQPVILDFGFARDDTSVTPTLTRDAEVFGTPAYMSPEQALPGSSPLDQRTDVYSLGASLYEALTLRRACPGPTPQAVYEFLRNEEPIPPSMLNPRISRDLEIVILTALEKDLTRRYRTALDVAEELLRVRRHEPIRARPASLRQRLARWVRRNPGLAASLAVIVLVSTSAAVVFFRQARLARQEQREKAQLAQRYERLEHAVGISPLRDEKVVLLQRRPHSAAEMRDWIDRAELAAAKFSGFREELRGYRSAQDPLPFSEEERSWRVRLPKESLALRMLMERLSVARQWASENKLPASMVVTLEQELASGRGRVREIYGRADSSVMTIVMEKAERDFEGLNADLRHMRQRLEETVRGFAVPSWDAAWAASRVRLKRNDKYEGLELRPQYGLLPLGTSSQSGLEEFLHLESHEGAIPASGHPSEMTKSTGIILVLIPSGRFIMGEEAREGERHPPYYEMPHEVRLPAFFIAKYEMTRAQWRRIVPGGEDLGGGDALPVAAISWYDCDRHLPTVGLDLPSEEQWEYAARGGSATRWPTGDRVESLEGAANLLDFTAWREKAAGSNLSDRAPWEDGYVLTAPVHTFAPNGFGLHHVVGNVAEWCRIWSLVGERSLESAEIPARVAPIRGGHCMDVPKAARSGARGHHPADQRYPFNGVRPVRSLE